MSTCTICDAPIRWVKKLGGKSIPTDAAEAPDGNGALLEGRFAVITRARFDDLTDEERARIPADMTERWRAALDGPRYRIHSEECRAFAALKIKRGEMV